jgi:hypothetical protein
MIKYSNHTSGGREVAGSNPVIPTKLIQTASKAFKWRFEAVFCSGYSPSIIFKTSAFALISRIDTWAANAF